MQALSKIIMAFVMILIGVVLTGVVAEQTLIPTSRTVVSDEIVNYAGARLEGGVINTTYTLYPTYYATGWQLTDGGSDCLPGATGNGFVLKNSTGTTMTETTNYVLADDGSFTLVNTENLNNSISNNTLVSYKYCQDAYLNSGFGRTSILLIGGFFALAVMLIGVAMFYQIVKETELI